MFYILELHIMTRVAIYRDKSQIQVEVAHKKS